MFERKKWETLRWIVTFCLRRKHESGFERCIRFTFHCFTAGDLEFFLGVFVFVGVFVCLGLVVLFGLLSDFEINLVVLRS